MSAHQMVCHLNDSFLMMTGVRPVSDASSFLNRTIVKWIALYGPSRWPPGIRTSPEIDQEIMGTCPADFAQDVRTLQSFVETIAGHGSSFEGRTHPVFGPMSGSAWLRLAYLHTDHHLRQFGA
jgi:hypothetical protein